ncbi:hypothetical protein ABBQ38_004896 [Trebouxia sp. C0009 RCD-2024]
MEAVFRLLTVLLAASYCQAAGVDQTGKVNSSLIANLLGKTDSYRCTVSDVSGVNSTELQVVASQPLTVSCDAPSPLGKYDSYCEGLRADYFLLPKQQKAPSLIGLSPNVSTFITSLNDTAAALSFKGVNALIAAKKYSFAVRYTGVLFFDIAGRYEFFLKSPAGTRLTINGNTVTFDAGSASSTPSTGYNFAQAGYIPIELVFFHENAVPSLEVQWTGPADGSVQKARLLFVNVSLDLKTYEGYNGSSIQFNCSDMQNTTNSMPPKTAAFCSGLSAAYYSQWANSSFATATGGVATYAIYEQGLNHWSTTTTPSWANLPPSLKSSFSGRYNGQLWIPLPGTYTFKLSATNNAALFVGNDKILNSTAINGVAQPVTTTYTFATAGYTPLGLNFLSRKAAPPQAGVLRLAWKGPNSPAFKVVYGFSHPCSTFVACSNSTTAGALPAEVVGIPPAGTTIESASAIKTAHLATYIPNSNVTFTLGFPALNAEDPSVEDVSYFVREAVANAAGLRLESVWTIPSLDDDGNIVFPIGAYFTNVDGAQRFYNLVNLRPQTIFSSSAGLYDFYPITVSPPDLGTSVTTSQPSLQPARPMATLVTATGESDDIPLPATPLPTPTSTPNVTVANTTTTGDIASPSPTAAPTDTPMAATPNATFTPIETLLSAVPATPTPTPSALAPAPIALGTPEPVVRAAVAPAPETAVPLQSGTAVAPAPMATTSGIALAPAPEGTAVAIDTAVAPAPEGTVTSFPIATPLASAPAPEATAMPADSAVAPAPEDSAMPVSAIAPALEDMATSMPFDSAVAPAPSEGAATREPVVASAPAPADATSPLPSDMALPTPVAPAPAPVPADLPTPIPTAAATPMAPSPAPVAPEIPVTGMPTAGAPAPAHQGAELQAPAPAVSPAGSSHTPTVPFVYGSPATPFATPAAYGPSGAVPHPAPGPAPGVTAPAATPSSAATPSPMAYSPAGVPVGGSQSAPSPVPSPYPALTLTPTRTSPYVVPNPTSPIAYSPPPSPYSPPSSPLPSPYMPVVVPSSSSSPPASYPVETIPPNAFLVYAPPSPPPTRSPSPTSTSPTPYASSTGTGSSPGYSPSQGAYPSPTPVPTSPVGTLFGSPGSSPIFSSPSPTPYGYPPMSPTAPATPGYPTSPVTLGAPTSPATPYTPGYPASPVTPHTPGYPTSPVQPRPTGYSFSPATPEAPTSPVNPRPTGYPAGPPAVFPSPAQLPVYYGLPITCPPGAASCKSGPYVYYAPQGDKALTPVQESVLLGQSPSPRSPAAPQTYFSPLFGSPRSPRGAFAPAPAPGPMVGPFAALAPAPGPTAQCACDPTDATPRSVKIEVLSTSYNSTASDTIKFNAYLTFSHPTRSLNSSQVRVFTRQPSDNSSGTVTTPGVVTVLQPISQNCAFYSLKGYVSESNPFAVNSTSIFLAAGGNILDACGSPFNVTVTRVEQAHRLQGLLYATGVAYSQEAGALLDGNVLNLALAFTDAVPRLSAHMFSVTGPPQMTTTELERVDGSDSYFTFSVAFPEKYYGSVTVSMNKAGKKYLTSLNPAAVAPTPLTLSRADPATQGSLVNSTKTRSL